MPFDLDEITSQSLSPHCLRCILNRFLDASPADAPWRERADYLRTVLRTVADNSQTMTAPEISYELERVLEETFGVKHDLSQKKAHFNSLMLGVEERLGQLIRASAAPLETAVRYTLAGNFIDFFQSYDIDDQKILALLDESAQMGLDEDALADLVRRMRSAKTVAFLTDNCGEIVLDKLLIAEILRANPEAQVTVIVRGGPASNDATMEDALQAGLTEICPVMGNGDNVAGTVLSRVNEATRIAIETSDLVISKGLANYETLSGRGRNTYFLFLCKCELYSKVFGVPLYDGLIVRGI